MSENKKDVEMIDTTSKSATDNKTEEKKVPEVVDPFFGMIIFIVLINLCE